MEYIIGFPEMIFAAFCFLFLGFLRSKEYLINWPFIGMLPSVILNLHRLHDWGIDHLSRSACTFVFKGPWFTDMSDILVTCDPANMRYIFNTHFANYPKGAEYKEVFDFLGDGIFNADYESWKLQRKAAIHLINHKKFQLFVEQTSYEKVENALIPVMEHVLKEDMVVDLQDVFKRFTFDTTFILLAGIDPGCLSKEFSKILYLHALEEAEEAVFYRHVIPIKWWKLQRRLGMGKEGKLTKARENLDEFIAQCISSKREKMKSCEKGEKSLDILSSYMEEDGSISDIFLRDTLMNFMLAGSSTLTTALTWFFWLVSKNPAVHKKIMAELKSKAVEGTQLKMFNMEELKGFTYLYGALCETLRLFPSVPVEHKKPLHADVLPSGHKVGPNTKIFPLIYAMGRMETIWGEDCLEFKPERWISEQGGIAYVPSYKFMSFNSGPRSCIGKDIAFTQMRMVAVTLLYNYQVEVEINHSIVVPNRSGSDLIRWHNSTCDILQTHNFNRK
ncbi:hypothetical protein ACHQM5_022299 [Ranunculus cassubicifolius]